MSIKCYFGFHDETHWEWIYDTLLSQECSLGFMETSVKKEWIGDLGLKFCNRCDKCLDSKRVYRRVIKH